MKREPSNPDVVELSTEEMIVHEWYLALLNAGYSHGESVERILDATKVSGPTWDVLNNQEFRNWLLKGTPTEDCTATLTVGPAHDPHSADCDLTAPHERHEGRDPYGTPGRVSWLSGNGVRGSNIQWHPATYAEEVACGSRNGK